MANNHDISNRDLATIVNLHVDICHHDTLCFLWVIIILCLNGFNAPLWTMVLAGIALVDAFVKKNKTIFALKKIINNLNKGD